MSDESVTIGRGVLQLDVDATGAQTKLDATTRSVDAYVKKIQQQAANVGKTAAELKLQELAQRGATQAQLDAVAAAQRTIQAYRDQQTEARKAAQEAIALARQQAAAQALASGSLNSIQLAETTHSIRALFEMIATGQNPLRALATEGFRFSSIMGGVKQAFQALASIFTTGRVLAGALAAAVGGVAYAFYEGAQQSREFNESVIKTGNFAGLTGAGFTDMSRTVAEATHSTIGSVRELGIALLQSGEIPRQVFEQATAAATAYAKLTGKTAEEVAKDFVELLQDPKKAALDLNKSMNLLTSQQYQTIKAFQDQNDKASAASIIFALLTERADKLRESQGLLGQTLDWVKEKWSHFWDNLNDGGRDSEDRIKRRIEYINQLLSNPDIGNANGPQAYRGVALRAEKTGLEMQLAAQAQAAQNQADAAELNKRAIAGSQFVEDLAKRGKAVSLYKVRLDELNKAIEDNKKAGTPISAADIAAAKAGLDKEYGDKSAVQDARARAVERAAAVKAGFEQQIKDQQNALTILEAQRGAGLVDEQDYYDKKAALVEKDKDLTVASLVAQRAEFQKIAPKLTGSELSENAKKIIELTTQISDAQKKAATQEVLISLQRIQASRAVIAAYQAELAAAQNLLAVQNRNQAREVRAVGLGDAERNRLAQRNALQDSYDAQRIQADQAKAQLLALGKYTDTQERMYKDKLAVINEFEQQALDSFDRYQEQLKTAQASALNGANRAVQNYLSQAANIADQTASLVTDVFSGLEDVLSETLSKGKANWSSFWQTIQADVNKIAIKGIFSDLLNFAKGGGLGDGIAGLVGKLVGGAGKVDPAMIAQDAAISANTLALGANSASLAAFNVAVLAATETLALMAANNAGKAGGDALGTFIEAMGWGGHALGGPVSAGKLYPVNERGPELLNVAGKQYLMMGSANDGSITPNSALTQATGNSTTVIVNVSPPPGASRATASQFGETVGRQIQAAMRRNG